jgi:hypothetical protein
MYLTDFNTSVSRPVTLYINKESREETLKQYRVIFAVGCEKNRTKLVICFNPSVDTVFISARGSFACLARWTLFLAMQVRILDEVKFLEIRDWTVGTFIYRKKILFCQKALAHIR